MELMAIDNFKVIVLKTNEESINKDLLEKYKQSFEICGDVVLKIDQLEKVKIYVPMRCYEMDLDYEKTKEGYLINGSNK